MTEVLKIMWVELTYFFMEEGIKEKYRQTEWNVGRIYQEGCSLGFSEEDYGFSATFYLKGSAETIANSARCIYNRHGIAGSVDGDQDSCTIVEKLCAEIKSKLYEERDNFRPADVIL